MLNVSHRKKAAEKYSLLSRVLFDHICDSVNLFDRGMMVSKAKLMIWYNFILYQKWLYSRIIWRLLVGSKFIGLYKAGSAGPGVGMTTIWDTFDCAGNNPGLSMALKMTVSIIGPFLVVLLIYVRIETWDFLSTEQHVVDTKEDIVW